MHKPQIRNPSFLSLLVAVIFTNLLFAQMLHEAGHWVVLRLSGRDPIWALTGLVQLWDHEPLIPDQWVEMVSSTGETGWLHLSSLPDNNAEWAAFLVAGPLAQLLAIVIGLMMTALASCPLSRTIGLMVALVNSFGHFFYQIVSALRGGGGDETLLASYLGISWPLISLIFGTVSGVGLLVGLGLLPSMRTRRRWVAALVLGTLPIGPLLMLANEFIIDQVDANNPLFRHVLGFPLPVLLLGLLSLLAIILVVRRWKPTEKESKQPVG